MNSTLAPIILFAYKRVDSLELTIEALQKNHLARSSDLYVFVDGPKRPEDADKVDKVKAIVKQIKGFKNVTCHFSENNKGLANSVIGGVSKIINEYGKAIVIEDDIITSYNFLDYMNQSLERYKDEKKVFSISAYTFPLSISPLYQYDAYFIPRIWSWGWATWADRWNKADWEVKDYNTFVKDAVAVNEFSIAGRDLNKMLREQMRGEIDSWAVRWQYSQYKNNGLTLYPTISKTQNNGFDTEATHTNIYNRYKTGLDTSRRSTFNLPVSIQAEPSILKLYSAKFSIRARLVGRIKTYMSRVAAVISL